MTQGQHQGQWEYFARCAGGFERVLAGELRALRVRQVRPLQGGVSFSGGLEAAYRACLWCRTATRVQLVLARVDARDADELYAGVAAFPWENHLRPGATIAVRAHGENPELRNTQFTALKVKDALCDRLRDARGVRPDVDAHDPDFSLDVALHRDRATLYLNLSGESLHRRGYRKPGEQVEAPLKETLAAGILLAAGWDRLCRDAARGARRDATGGEGREATRDAAGDAHRDAAGDATRDAADLAFVDPMCGSGTFAIEAALVAADIAPGLGRRRWGFGGWALHDDALWQAERRAALARARAGLAAWGAGTAPGPAGVAPAPAGGKTPGGGEPPQAGEGAGAAAGGGAVHAGNAPGAAGARAAAGNGAPGAPARRLCIVGGDVDARAIRIAREDAARAGVGALVEFHVCDAAKLAGALGVGAGRALAPAGLMAVNPPYGYRLGDAAGVPAAHAALAEAAVALAPGWRLAVITPDDAVDTALGLAPEESFPCYNGPLEATVRLYRVDPARRTVLELVSLAGAPRRVAVAEPHSEQFAARLRKVAKARAKWARRAGVSCYRLYDADLPDYAVAVDLYAGAGPDEGARYLRVAEYHAPDTVDADRAARRLADALAVAPAVLDLPAGNVFCKVRRHAKGGGQYREAQARPFVICVEEAGYRFEVDLNGRLDTGIFLDHRATRALVGRLAAGRRFLNLFAYTGTATVHAAGGGARTTTTVDLSQTYVDWARRNLAANGFGGRAHRLVRDDVKGWLDDAAYDRRRYDLVFCDPPTFSNSKSRGAAPFDVQRDHMGLLRRVAAVLSEEGVIVFSCNLRRFKLDAEGLAALGLAVRDITAATIPPDFERNPKVHRCYLLAWDRDVLDQAARQLEA